MSEQVTNEVPWEVEESRPGTTSAVAEYSRVEAGLADLRARYNNVVFDLTTTAGDKAARAARKELVTTRTTLESIRKEVKAPLLAKAKLLDEEAKRITTEILALETPIDEQIKADERRREEERAAREAAERARVDDIRKQISEIAAFPAKCAASTAADIEQWIKTLEVMPITAESFFEFVDEAEAARMRAMSQMRTLHAAAVTREEEAARLAAERAELDRQRAELERQRAEEAARVAAERKAEEERIAAERAEFERQMAAAAELQRIADEQRRREQERLAAERKAQEDALQAELEEARRQIREQRFREQAEREAQEAAARARQTRLHNAAELMLQTLAAVRNDLTLVLGDKTPAALMEAAETTLPNLREMAHLAIVDATEEKQ